MTQRAGVVASPATRVQATQSGLRAQCWAHWAALWVWGITWSESALKLTKPLEYWRVFGTAQRHPLVRFLSRSHKVSIPTAPVAE